MTKILLITTIEQIHTLEKDYPDVLSDANYIVGLDLDVLSLLEKMEMGTKSMSVSDLIPIDKLTELDEKSTGLMNNWFKPVEGHFQVDGISPLHLEATDMLQVIIQSLVAGKVIQRLCTQFNVKQISFFQCRQRPGYISKDIFPAIWLSVLEDSSVYIKQLSVPSEKKHFIQKFSRKIRQSLANLKNPVIKHFIQKFFAKSENGQVIFSILVSEMYRFSDIAGKLENHFGNRVLFTISGGRSLGSVTSGGVQYNSMSLLPGIGYLSLLAMGRQWFRRWQEVRHLIPDYPEIFQNPHLDYQFRFLFQERIPNLIQTYRESKRIFSTYQTKVLLTSSVASLYSNGVSQAAHDLDIPVITIPHSGFVNRVDYQLSGDVTLSWTKDAAQAWQKYRQIESRFIGLPESVVTRGYHQIQSETQDTQERKRITLLLATAELGGVPYVDTNLHQQTLEAILDIPDDLQDKVLITLKLHPKHDYRYFYDHLVQQVAYPESIQIIREMPLEKIIQLSDLTVLVNIPTSAYFLPLLQNVPEIFIDTAGYHAMTVAYNEDNSQAVIKDIKAIWPRFRAALFDPSTRQAILDANQHYKNRYIDSKANPVQTIIQLLEQHTS